MTGPNAPLPTDPMVPDEWLDNELPVMVVTEPRRGYVSVGIFGAVLGAAVTAAVLILFLHYRPVDAASRTAAQPVIPAAALRGTASIEPAASGNLAARPSGAPIPVVAPSPTPDLQQASGASSLQGVRGVASWYEDPKHRRGIYAAAGPALRVGSWRGRRVLACTESACVEVRLTDWCACPQRVIDLSSDAFSRLAPLSRGLVRVTVEWGGPQRTPPATDVEP